MFKKILALCLTVLMLSTLCVTFASCGDKKGEFKLGVILLHDEKSTYDLNFINGVNAAAEALGKSLGDDFRELVHQSYIEHSTFPVSNRFSISRNALKYSTSISKGQSFDKILK